MADNEMLKNAVKALERKYLKNGFIAVNDEEALMSAIKLAGLMKKRENKDYFLVIPCNALVDHNAENLFYLADCKSKMVGYMFDRRNGIDALFEVQGGQVTDLLWKRKKEVVVTERPTINKFKENSWDKIVALKKEGEEKRNQILAVGKKQIESILKKGEK